MNELDGLAAAGKEVVVRGLSRFHRPVGVALGAAAVVGLVVVGVGVAANPGREKVALTAAGSAQAKADVLTRADVGAGWSGGAQTPDLVLSSQCSTYHPKQSDLVLIGAAQTHWRKQALTIVSMAQVLKTSAMVQRDWQRTVLAPQVLPCLRQVLAKGMSSGGDFKGKVVSLDRLAFPEVEPDTRAFRAVAVLSGARGSVRVVFDFVALGAWRNELTLLFGGPATGKAPMHSAEISLAYQLAGRIRP